MKIFFSFDFYFSQGFKFFLVGIVLDKFQVMRYISKSFEKGPLSSQLTCRKRYTIKSILASLTFPLRRFLRNLLFCISPSEVVLILIQEFSIDLEAFFFCRASMILDGLGFTTEMQKMTTINMFGFFQLIQVSTQ